jgi:NAD(P)-dependent dehydrogenase (short-subunit alcohol dehydrogenase family)
MGRLEGKVAIVTGAASQAEGVGNGAATATLFAREGARVVLVNRGAERAEALAESIRAEGGEAAAFAADVTRAEATEAMAAFAVERYGRLTSCITTSGSAVPARRRRSTSRTGTGCWRPT